MAGPVRTSKEPHMPESYRPHLRKDDQDARTSSQTVSSNTSATNALVGELLAKKDSKLFTIRPHQTLQDAVGLLKEHRIGALLVTDANGALIGILSERDIVRKLADTPDQTMSSTVEDVMTKKVETCTAEDALVTVLTTMTEGRFRHLPVVDSDKALIGLVTIGDVVHFRLNQLELEALQIKQLIVG